MADPDPAAELPATRVDGGRGQPTVDAPARWSGAAAVPPREPKRRRWPSRRPEPVEHTAVDPDDWASIPAVDPWAGMDTEWDDPLTEVPLPPTAIEPPAPAPAPPPTAAAPPPPSAPAPSPPAAAAPTPPPTKVAPAVASAAVLPQEPKPSWWDRLARHREPLEREVRERAARQGEALQRAAQQQATKVRESMAKAAKTAPPVVSRLPVQPRPPAAAPPAGPPSRPGWAPPAGPPSPPAGPPPRPGWAPSAQRPFPPAPPPSRNRRRRPRRLLLFVLLLMVGVPLLYERFPAARQYPVSASLPDSFSDLSLRDDNASRKAADRLAAQLDAAGADGDDVFTGVYADGRGKRVTLFGVTGWRFTPGSDAEAEIDRLADDFDFDGATPYDTGELGVTELCATGRANGSAVVVCAWADHGSMAAVLLTRRSQDESADLVGRLREAVLTRG